MRKGILDLVHQTRTWSNDYSREDSLCDLK